MELVITTPETLFSLVKDAITEHEAEITAQANIKLFSINQVAKKLGMSHSTISKFVENGIIKSTKSRKITEEAINEYLKNI